MLPNTSRWIEDSSSKPVMPGARPDAIVKRAMATPRPMTSCCGVSRFMTVPKLLAG